jgi:hypothetical protein
MDMHLVLRTFHGFSIALGVLWFAMPAWSDGLLGVSATRSPVPVKAPTLSPVKPVLVGKRLRHKTSRKPLELTLPRLTFSSAAPSAATQALPPIVLLEPYEPARFHRFGPSPFRPVTSLANSLHSDPLKDEPFRIGFSQDWNMQWDLLQDSTPATGHHFGVNIGLQRKF